MFNNIYNVNSYSNSQTNKKQCCSKSVSNKAIQSSSSENASQEITKPELNYGLYGFPLASVYAPIQDFTNIYDCETALQRGTIFGELDLPFVCGGMSGGVMRG